jgi:repressor LexA
MPPQILTTESLTQVLRGKQVAHASFDGKQRLSIQFSDGASLVVEASSKELVVVVKRPEVSASKGTVSQPTKRQLEYLAFIAKYIAKFGRSPAESDIERHFLVSAPSVNQMMQTLERRGFIARQQGVPRSVRICIEL